MQTFLPLLCIAIFAIFTLPSTQGLTRHFTFNVDQQNITRLCQTRSVITVNGKFPGPRLAVREGDRVIVRVFNNVSSNMSIHWHGVKQLTTGWADGPSYVTQCPIQTGNAYTYNFTVSGQRGTLWWHAHVSWLRASVHGPIIIYPRKNHSYPFVKPFKEIPIILGEWFNSDPEAIVKKALETGAGPNVSDAYTINGLPGPLYNCSAKDTYKLRVEAGRTYLLRLINAVLNEELFFSIANHTLTVVEIDASYIKPFTTSTLLIAPGQTMNVILEARPTNPNATFFISARPYTTAAAGTFDNTTVAGILTYSSHSIKTLPLFKPNLPPINASSFVTNFTSHLRSLATVEFPTNVPLTVDKNLFFTVGLGAAPCINNATCQGPNGTKFAASVNNISFALPSVSLLQSYYESKGAWDVAKFPEKPLHPFNYTGTPPTNILVSNATKLIVLPYNTSVELVMQGTSILGVESHPLHIHGYNFFVVGRGIGNYDAKRDPLSYNLVDPVERNTVDVPAGGWVAIRFVADNPGVWFMHCHLDVHLSWGLRMAWVVLDGSEPGQKLQPPPADLPRC